MSTRRHKSEAQSNAEALARRDAPYTAVSGQSFRVAWDWRQREPETLREAVRAIRQAYAAEVPTKLHEGADSIGEGGTPKMTARAEGYLFGSPTSDDASRDAETGERDVVGYYYSPFRARLADMGKSNETDRKVAAIVAHITIGSQGPKEAAIREGVPRWLATEGTLLVLLGGFLRHLSALTIHAKPFSADGSYSETLPHGGTTG